MPLARFVRCIVCCSALGFGVRAHGEPPKPPTRSALEPLLTRGSAALAAGDSISAIGLFRTAIQRAPHDVRGYVALGNAYLSLSEPHLAREVFEAAARNTRGVLAVALGLAQSDARLGNYERALTTLRERAEQAEPELELLRAELAERTLALTEALAVRRAMLNRLRSTLPETAPPVQEARAHVLALTRMLGAADRLAPAHCADTGAHSPVLDALRSCPLPSAPSEP